MKALSQLIFIVFFLFMYNEIHGQDSLWQNVKKSSTVYEEAAILSQIYRNNMYTDAEQSDKAANKLIINAIKINNDSLLLKGYKGKAQIKMLQSSYDSALYYLDLKGEIFDEKTDIKVEKANDFHLRALIYYYKAEYEKSIEYNFKAVELRKSMNDNDGLSRSFNNLGISFERLKENKKAIEYYNQSLHFTSPDDMYGKAALMSNMAIIHNNLHEYKEAKKLLLKAKPIADSIDHPTLIIDINSTLSQIYTRDKEYDKALLITDDLLRLTAKQKDIPRQVGFHNMKGTILIKQNRLEEAIKQLRKGILLSESVNIGQHEEELYNNLSLAYKNNKNFKKSLEYKDSLLSINKRKYNQEKLKITEELDIKYKTALKDQELLNSQQKITKRSYQRNFALLGSGILLMLGFFLWKRSKDKQQKIETENKLQSEKIKNLEKEKTILSLASMIEGQEAERVRIAQDLHDGLGGLLSSVKNHFSLIHDEVKKLDQLNVYDRTNSMIDQACKEVRRISHNLMPASLQLNGLISTVSQYCSDVEASTKLEVHFEHTGMEDIRLGDTKEIFIYRIVQEAVANVLKHANASTLLVQLGLYEREISLIIEDNGSGFDANTKSDGIGLKSIKSRVEHIKGLIDIDSKIGTGTTITINIPYDIK